MGSTLGRLDLLVHTDCQPPVIHCCVQQSEGAAKIPEEHKTIVNVDSERPLICVRASGAHSEISLGPHRIGIGVAIGTFEIEDLLVGPRCKQHSHLARSYESASRTTITVGVRPISAAIPT